MLGIALREVREENGWARKVIAAMVHASESLVSEWEHGRRRITETFRPVLARKIDDGRFYMAAHREATDGVMAEPWLNNIDEHRLVCALKLKEELQEAIAAVDRLIPILLEPPERANKEDIEEIMMEVIEEQTAGKNTTARIAKTYGISLARIWDRHQKELEEKGYIKKNTASRAVM